MHATNLMCFYQVIDFFIAIDFKHKLTHWKNIGTNPMFWMKSNKALDKICLIILHKILSHIVWEYRNTLMLCLFNKIQFKKWCFFGGWYIWFKINRWGFFFSPVSKMWLPSLKLSRFQNAITFILPIDTFFWLKTKFKRCVHIVR